MVFFRTSVPNGEQELILNPKTIRQKLDTIKAMHSKKENLYNLNAELADTVWTKQTAEDYFGKVSDLRRRMDYLKAQDNSLFIAKKIDEMPGLMKHIQIRDQKLEIF